MSGWVLALPWITLAGIWLGARIQAGIDAARMRRVLAWPGPANTAPPTVTELNAPSWGVTTGEARGADQDLQQR